MKVLIVAAIIIAIALFAAIVAPVFALLIKNSTANIPMFWNGSGWEELTTPYNLNPPHNSSMIIVK